MGKGDRRSKRGKIWLGTNGKSRPKKCNACKAETSVAAAKPAAKPAAKKAAAPKAEKPAAAKKPAAKKAAE